MDKAKCDLLEKLIDLIKKLIEKLKREGRPYVKLEELLRRVESIIENGDEVEYTELSKEIESFFFGLEDRIDNSKIAEKKKEIKRRSR